MKTVLLIVMSAYAALAVAGGLHMALSGLPVHPVIVQDAGCEPCGNDLE